VGEGGLVGRHVHWSYITLTESTIFYRGLHDAGGQKIC
jgi:hypothetical protein